MTTKKYNVSTLDSKKDENVKSKQIPNISVTVENNDKHLWTLEEAFDVIGKKISKDELKKRSNHRWCNLRFWKNASDTTCCSWTSSYGSNQRNHGRSIHHTSSSM